jgi:hypothetical protein
MKARRPTFALPRVFHPCWFVTLFASVFVTGTIQFLSAQDRCADIEQFTPDKYWLWEGYLGVQDVSDSGGERRGRLVNEPRKCFRVPLDQLQDPIARIRGYKQAVVEWVHWLSDDAKAWDKDSRTLAARQKLKALTGHDFSSKRELKSWWDENNDYLVWSDDAGHLVVDEEAKKGGKPIAPLNPVQEITAEMYWFYQGMGWVRESVIEDEHIRGRAWTGDRNIKFQTQTSKLGDRTNKEMGYSRALRKIIEERLPVPELGESGFRQLAQRLQALTGQNFQDRQSWIRWWNANQSRLVLSGDGEQLVVRPR